MPNEIIVSDKKEFLTEKEKKALEKFQQDLDRPKLSLEKSLQLFELFLNGYSCQEIAKANKGLGLGVILEARLEHEWDDKKKEYLDDLYAGVTEKYKKVQLESVGFISDLLAVTHKKIGNQLKSFLQTGNYSDIDSISLVNNMSIDSYRKSAELLLRMTGQGDGSNRTNNKTNIQIVGQEVAVNASSEEKTEVKTPELPNDSKFAKELLVLLSKQEEDK